LEPSNRSIHASGANIALYLQRNSVRAWRFRDEAVILKEKRRQIIAALKNNPGF
jgi:hypothetical protein